jgi:hypothetical protein
MGLSHQDLIAWQKAMDLAEEIYTATGGPPKDEWYDVTSQLRRAVISIPSKVAGAGRATPGEFRLLGRTLKRRSSGRVGCTIFQKSRSAVFSDCRQS